MTKRKKKEHDFSIIAHRVMQEATGQNESDEDDVTPKKAEKPDYAALGRAGGKKGGKSRAEKLSPERRKEIARKAAQARWER